MSTTTIGPGSTFGIIGGGQLGAMTAVAARRMGYNVAVYDPSPNAPAGSIAQKFVVGPFTSSKDIENFAAGVDVLTFEFENIPADVLRAAAENTRLAPHWAVLQICQNRAREKHFLRGGGFPCATFAEVRSPVDLESAIKETGLPAILKTADFGYDGKGQVMFYTLEEAWTAWENFGAAQGVVEEYLPFDKELSVIVGRSSAGTISTFPIAENRHRNHILDATIVPAELPKEAAAEAIDVASSLAEKLGVIGLLAVEMFHVPGRGVIINELAPRPHNSGHFSIEACVTSQFEQLVRLACGFEPGSTELIRPVGMLNLLGDLWSKGKPDWSRLLADPGIKLHLYNKKDAIPGRKMGHITLLGHDREQILARLDKAKTHLLDA